MGWAGGEQRVWAGCLALARAHWLWPCPIRLRVGARAWLVVPASARARRREIFTGWVRRTPGPLVVITARVQVHARTTAGARAGGAAMQCSGRLAARVRRLRTQDPGMVCGIRVRRFGTRAPWYGAVAAGKRGRRFGSTARDPGACRGRGRGYGIGIGVFMILSRPIGGTTEGKGSHALPPWQAGGKRGPPPCRRGHRPSGSFRRAAGCDRRLASAPSTASTRTYARSYSHTVSQWQHSAQRVPCDGSFPVLLAVRQPCMRPQPNRRTGRSAASRRDTCHATARRDMAIGARSTSIYFIGDYVCVCVVWGE